MPRLDINGFSFNRLIGIIMIPVSFFLYTACNDKAGKEIMVIWDGEKAVGVEIRKNILPGFKSIDEIEIQLVADVRGPMFGDYKEEKNRVTFRPVVPFTKGHDYEVFFRGKSVGLVSVPLGAEKMPYLVSIYPTQDTVPENLLKIYLQFSEPMVEGHSLENVLLIRNPRDTMKSTFLDLSPELWNSEGTVLTLWLDPGRIKRDLIPNKKLGAPLESFADYSLHVSGRWRSKEGIAMGADYLKKFTTSARDEQSPRVDQWDLTLPHQDTSDALIVRLRESLDFSLLHDAIHILDKDGKEISGTFSPGAEEKSISFVPAKPWTAGEYVLLCESRLEDLAGNNLNRPFDRDLKANPNTCDKVDHRRIFVVP